MILIRWFIGLYNKKVTVDKRIEFFKPETFELKNTIDINLEAYKEGDQKFLENIIQENLYDLRLVLIEQIWKDGFIKESIVKNKKSITLKITLKAFKNEKKRRKKNQSPSQK